MKDRFWYAVGYGGAAVVLLMALAATVSAGGRSRPARVVTWERWRPATCMPDRCFCEPVRGRTVRQPINTWSNLSFVGIGLAVLAQAQRDGRRMWPAAQANRMRTLPVYAWVYGLVTVSIGLTSGFYHSSLSFAGQCMDIASMYLLATFMLLYNMAPPILARPGAFAAGYLALNAVLLGPAFVWPVSRRPLFVLLVAGVLVSEGVRRWRRGWRRRRVWWWAALVSLALAGLVWILDLGGALCDPQSWFQGHALWHLFMAGAIGFVYLRYRSEEREGERSW